MASCKAEFENIKLAAGAIEAHTWTAAMHAYLLLFLEILSTCFITWLSTLASHMKHNITEATA